MTWLTEELFPGSWLTSEYPGVGVPGNQVPSDGDAGAAPFWYGLSLPADADKELRMEITRAPVNGTLVLNEDSSFTYTGSSDYFEYLLYVDNVASTSDIGYGPGISRVVLEIGITSGTFTGNCILGALTCVGGADSPTVVGERVKVTQNGITAWNVLVYPVRINGVLYRPWRR